MSEKTIKKEVILVIDDEPSVADALSLILSDIGYEVVVTLTGRDGLEKHKQLKFDITITDIRLPDISGLDVVSGIREKDPSSLVIVITSHSTPDVVAESLSRGAFNVLPKPFLPSEVLALISEALNTRRCARSEPES